MSEEQKQSGGGNGMTIGMVVATVVALWFLFSGSRSQPGRGTPATSASAVTNTTRQGAVNAVPDFDPERNRPEILPENGYVSSSACQECHPRNHQTWHDSYHRTMTQIPTKESVFGDFDEGSFTNSVTGHSFRMNCDGDNFQITMFPPGENDTRSPISWPIALLTGSHHMQAYWVPGKMGRTLSLLPVMFLKEEKKWVPRTSVFLQPPPKYHGLEAGRWNEGCIRCHATAGETRRVDPIAYHETRVAEFGISCEACHGPGEAHVKLRRELARNAKADNDPIVNPVNLSKMRGSQVCGVCHSRRLVRTGFDGTEYRPGDDLYRTHLVYRDEPEVLAELETLLPKMEQAESAEEEMRYSFWSDGLCRSSAAEFNAMLESPCFQRGQMTCFSCHQMHQSKRDPRPVEEWANDQLRHPQSSDASCLECHEGAKFANPSHTHHPAGSSGSSCYNCHMPHTSYGLMKAIRAHTVTSPDVKNTLATTRPNACNLCHLDKTLAWTAGHLKGWYGIEAPKLNRDQERISAAVLDLVKGDAGLRALIGWNMGWQPATRVSGRDWLVPYLASLLDDPYDTVRYIAGKSLKRIPGYEDLDYDFVGSKEHQSATVAQVQEQWFQASREDRSEVLIREGRLQQSEFDRLLSRRDLRPLLLKE